MKRPPPPDLAGQLELVRPPAPGGLELVRGLINTRSVERGTDAIATPETLAAWLRERGLLDRKTKATIEDVESALEVREVLRAFGLRNNGMAYDCDARVLNAAAERSGLMLDFDPGGGAALLRPRQPTVAGAIGVLLAAVHRAMLDRSWSRLKVCCNPACLWAYYDSSKNGCSRWCSAEGCGNRAKVKAYRERRAQTALAGSATAEIAGT